MMGLPSMVPRVVVDYFQGQQDRCLTWPCRQHLKADQVAGMQGDRLRAFSENIGFVKTQGSCILGICPSGNGVMPSPKPSVVTPKTLKRNKALCDITEGSVPEEMKDGWFKPDEQHPSLAAGGMQ